LSNRRICIKSIKFEFKMLLLLFGDAENKHIIPINIWFSMILSLRIFEIASKLKSSITNTIEFFQ